MRPHSENAPLFFFSSRRQHTRCSRDWSSDVCSSDLYRRRVLALVTLKGEGKAVPLGGPEVPRIRVIDLMDALTQSLAQRASPAATPGVPSAPMPKKPPGKVGTRAPAATPGRLEKRPQA